jgi:hypothetical protein
MRRSRKLDIAVWSVKVIWVSPWLVDIVACIMFADQVVWGASPVKIELLLQIQIQVNLSGASEGAGRVLLGR